MHYMSSDNTLLSLTATIALWYPNAFCWYYFARFHFCWTQHANSHIL